VKYFLHSVLIAKGGTTFHPHGRAKQSKISMHNWHMHVHQCTGFGPLAACTVYKEVCSFKFNCLLKTPHQRGHLSCNSPIDVKRCKKFISIQRPQLLLLLPLIPKECLICNFAETPLLFLYYQPALPSATNGAGDWPPRTGRMRHAVRFCSVCGPCTHMQPINLINSKGDNYKT
jgi:hypothetical protein